MFSYILLETTQLNPNSWDDGFEGNYWSDYNGTDVNDDGFGDSPYVLDENNADNFPLTKQPNQSLTMRLYNQSIIMQPQATPRTSPSITQEESNSDYRLTSSPTPTITKGEGNLDYWLSSPNPTPTIAQGNYDSDYSVTPFLIVTISLIAILSIAYISIVYFRRRRKLTNKQNFL